MRVACGIWLTRVAGLGHDGQVASTVVQERPALIHNALLVLGCRNNVELCPQKPDVNKSQRLVSVAGLLGAQAQLHRVTRDSRPRNPGNLVCFIYPVASLTCFSPKMHKNDWSRERIDVSWPKSRNGDFCRRWLPCDCGQQ